MPVVRSPDRYPLAREELKQLEPPFLLRHYDATPTDYENLTDEDLKCEYVDGELIVHSPATFKHENLTAFVLALLREYVARHALGYVLGSNAVMQLGERRFSPDVSVLKNEHAGRVREGRVYGPMDLVVEVLSVSTRDYDQRTKVPAFREGHVPEIWLIDPDRRQFEVHALHGENYIVQTLTTGRWASPALPGFSLDVDWLWRDPLPAVADCRVS